MDVDEYISSRCRMKNIKQVQKYSKMETKKNDKWKNMYKWMLINI